MGIESEKKNGFDAVYEEYHKMVFRIAYHYTCNREEAEDISQVVFGRYYIFSETGRLELYVRKMKSNVHAGYWRH